MSGYAQYRKPQTYLRLSSGLAEDWKLALGEAIEAEPLGDPLLVAMGDLIGPLVDDGSIGVGHLH